MRGALEIKYISRCHKIEQNQVFSGDFSCCVFFLLKLVQSLGPAGTCAKGQMVTDSIRVPHFGQRQLIGTREKRKDSQI